MCVRERGWDRGRKTRRGKKRDVDALFTYNYSVRQRDRDTERQRYTDRQRQIDRQTDRHRARERERQTELERGRELERAREGGERLIKKNSHFFSLSCLPSFIFLVFVLISISFFSLFHSRENYRWRVKTRTAERKRKCIRTSKWEIYTKGENQRSNETKKCNHYFTSMYLSS